MRKESESTKDSVPIHNNVNELFGCNDFGDLNAKSPERCHVDAAAEIEEDEDEFDLEFIIPPERVPSRASNPLILDNKFLEVEDYLDKLCKWNNILLDRQSVSIAVHRQQLEC